MVVVFVGISLLLVALALPLARRQIPPNRFYGLRTRATYADPHVWYDANAVAGRAIVLIGTLNALLAMIVGSVLSIESRHAIVVCSGFLIVTTVLVAIYGTLIANRMLKRRGQRS